ncbi:MAG: nucleotidyltransferase, partial [Planctomycetes bacterium]|nr:nucleotidyltransferase [Planctomycetota bacterium]
MTKQSITDMLSRLQPEINHRFRARMKGFFGSYARGDQSDGSDLDVLVD